MSSETELNFIKRELEEMNEVLSTISENLERQDEHLQKIANSFSTLNYLLQFNIGVNLNSNALVNMSQYLKEINDKI